MKPNPAAAPVDDEALERMLDAHHQRTRMSLITAGLLACAVFGLLLSHGGTPAHLATWLAALLATLLARAFCAQVYQRGGKRIHGLQRWLTITRVTVTVGGLAWGALAFFYLSSPDAGVRVLVTLILTGIVAGMAFLVHSVPGVAQGFGVAALAPLAGVMAMEADPFGKSLAGLVLVYLVAICVVAPSILERRERSLSNNMSELDAILQRAEIAERMAHVGHFVWDHRRNTATLSAEARDFFGLSHDRQATPQVLWSRVHEHDRERVLGLSRAAVRAGRQELRFETQLYARSRLCDIQVVQRFDYSAQRRLVRTLTTVADITSLKDAQRELHQLAFRDALTGLANRGLFSQRLDHVIEACQSTGGQAAVAMLDLDHFKKVNDSLGHNAGDILLKQTAERLRAAVREGDIVARLGGDEFAVIFMPAPAQEALAERALDIIARLSQPYTIDEVDVFVSCSIGLALAPQDGLDGDAVLRCADVALFEAKARGRSSHYFFDAGLSERANERLVIEADLRHAIEHQELTLHYQPKVDLLSGQTIGAEALLRWHHPTRGLVAPDRFIGIAEDTGLIVPIGTWVLRSACEAARDWNRARNGGVDFPPGTAESEILKIAVNLSARQFMNQDIVALTRGVLEETGCLPSYIELEITESLLFDDRAGVLGALRGLRDLGLSIAIDDFGTGYSALGYLTRFPITTLKIDRSFIHSMADDSDRMGLVNAIISMGKVLRLKLVAEGVETAPQAALLRSMGCDQAQGWLFGRPVPCADFESRLHTPG